MPPRSHGARSVLAGVCGVSGVLLLLLGVALSLGSRALFNADFFAGRVVTSLSDPRTASYVGDKLTDAVIAVNEDLILVRPLIKAAAQAVVSSDPFRAIARETLKQSHQLLSTRGGQDILLTASDFGVILKTALAGRPALAAKIPEDAVAVVGTLRQGMLLEISQNVMHQAARFQTKSRLIFALGAMLLLLGVLTARDTESALLRAGMAVAGVAALNLAAFELGASVIARLPGDPALGQALAGVWSAFVGGFYAQIFVLAGIGVLMIAAATAFLEAMQLPAAGRRVRSMLLEPAVARWARLLRAGFLLAVGIAAVSHPVVLIKSLVVVAGFVLGFVGLRELCRLAVDPAARMARRGEMAGVGAAKGRSQVFRPLAGVIVLIAAGIGAVFLVTPPAGDAPAGVANGCNGLPELCDRRLDQVVFAATHNAMGAADVPGWLFPNQQKGIRTQLEDGIRGLMIDVLSGIPIGRHVKTDLAEGELSREKLEPALGTEGFDAALRIRERLLGGEASDRDLYLCHGLCELGAVRLILVLKEIRRFLVANPREVLILIIEDAVPPSDVERAFVESRLIDFVYPGSVTPPWPTLAEMVDDGGRVLVLGENDTTGVSWYHGAWKVFQETPYHFSSPEEFSCEPNRGGTSGSLLLMNHWVTTPPTSLPSDAEVVNERSVLLGRVEQCRRERGRIPNVIAVDFYRTGDLLEVVAELNGNPSVR